MVTIALPGLGIREHHSEASAPLPTTRLTRKESDLLTLLVANANRCLRRDFLLQRVWGYQEGTRTRTLDVHIQRLRRKLGPNSSARILTILGSGYMWKGDGNKTD